MTTNYTCQISHRSQSGKNASTGIKPFCIMYTQILSHIKTNKPLYLRLKVIYLTTNTCHNEVVKSITIITTRKCYNESLRLIAITTMNTCHSETLMLTIITTTNTSRNETFQLITIIIVFPRLYI